MDCRDVREHLDTCSTCRADLASRRTLRDGVQRAFLSARDLDPRAEFSAQLRTKLAAADRQYSGLGASGFPGGGRSPRRSW